MGVGPCDDGWGKVVDLSQINALECLGCNIDD